MEKNPKYYAEHEIKIEDLKFGLEAFINEIQERNRYYSDKSDKIDDYIHWDIEDDENGKPVLIHVRLLYSFATIGRFELTETLAKHVKDMFRELD